MDIITVYFFYGLSFFSMGLAVLFEVDRNWTLRAPCVRWLFSDWSTGDMAIVDLGMLYGPYVAGCGVLSVWCYTRYRLTRERHAEILAELYARRGGPRTGTV